MDLLSSARLFLIYAHLMLCVFALHEVLVGDWRVLRRRLRPDDVQEMHRRVTWLLCGLWVSGLSVIALDVGFDASVLAAKPKALAKLVTVIVLSLNGVLLQRWCFPRLSRLETLGAAELSVVMVAGATSTASWLMAAFFGIARPLKDAPLVELLELYGAVLALAAVAALLLGAWWRRRPADMAGGQSLAR